MPTLRPLVADVEGDGPAVILLHGQPGRAGNWYRVTARLADRYTTVAPDRLGYGRTGGPAGDFADNAAATLALMDQMGIERAVIAAHSWAGGVALRLALDSSARVAGLVLVASVAPGDPVGRLDRLLARRPVGELAALATLGVAGRALAVPALRRAVSRALPDGPAEMVAQARPSRNAWRAFAAEQRVFVEQIDGMAADLRRIDVPTRVVIGSADKVVGSGAGTLLASGIPRAVLTTVPRAGHLLPWDHPEAVEAAVDAVAGG
ncbi:alpha/beta hydrolase [Acidiferrimicrobium sp. IK]|uniref:alpha/beta fold hydrolase n=1 Tax=Acidiferrimicrobium sp. IK TaxID=2871700 RepID=UPI0021CB39AC|nr:alpha/beta hydrolase [Acidiferrimicrobium sp. IK]MCU4185676.1 alpha/beta hydrolase [Acidiferrimicrobium sp. IK]